MLPTTAGSTSPSSSRSSIPAGPRSAITCSSCSTRSKAKAFVSRSSPSDGSTDGSEQLVRDLTPRGLRTPQLDHGGKGRRVALRLEAGQGRYQGFIDADGDIPAKQWHRFLTLIRMYNRPGCRIEAASAVRVQYPALRRVYSRIFSRWCALFPRRRDRHPDRNQGVSPRDAADVLPLLVETGFVFDLELLRWRRRGWRRVIEAPVRIEHRFHSTIFTWSVFPHAS